jgi:hypothetical protein
VPTAEAVFSLEVRRRDDVASDDRLRDTGCERLECLHGRSHDAIPCCLVPVRVTEMPRRVLKQRGDDVGAFGGERRVGEGRDRRLEIGLRGDPPVLRVVECSLEVVEARSDDDSPAQARVVDAEHRQGVEYEGHLRDHAGHPDVPGSPSQSRTDLGRVEKT